jgi:hypothetical protein
MLEATASPPTTSPSTTTNNNNKMDTLPMPVTTGSGVSENVAVNIAKRFVGSLSNPFPGVTNAKSFAGLLKKEFTKLVEVRSYTKPASAEQALSRIRANIAFFRGTYTSVFVIVLLLFILSNPTLFVATLLLIAMWSGFLSQAPDSVLTIGSVELKRNEKLVILGSSTVIVVVFGGLISSAIYIFFMSGLIIGTHAAFREPVVLDALEQLEQEGESIVKGDMV